MQHCMAMELAATAAGLLRMMLLGRILEKIAECKAHHSS